MASHTAACGKRTEPKEFLPQLGECWLLKLLSLTLRGNGETGLLKEKINRRNEQITERFGLPEQSRNFSCACVSASPRDFHFCPQ